MAKAIAIIIATAQDGTLSIVDGADGIMSRSQARARLPELKEEGFVKAELFDLRSPDKRRKFDRVQPATTSEESGNGDDQKPTIDEIAQQIFDNPDMLEKKDFRNGLPKVGVIEKLFGVDVNGDIVADIWAKVEALQAAEDDD